MQYISVILAHPYTHSLNVAIAATVVSILEKNGYGVHFHDLYRKASTRSSTGRSWLQTTAATPSCASIKKKSAAHTASSSSTPTGGGSRPPSLRAGWTASCGKTPPTPSPPATMAAACPPACCRPKPRCSSIPQTPPPSANRTSSATRSSASGKTASSPSAASTPLTVSCSGLSPTATKRHGGTGCNKRRKWSTNTSLPPHKTPPHPL